MILTDTHSHLYVSRFDNDRDAAVQRCLDNDVKRIFLPNIDSTSIDALVALSRKYPKHCFPMMGIHPCSVKDDYQRELEIARDWLFNQHHNIKFHAVGEIGIDLHWDKSTLNMQIEAFEQQIEWAKQLNLPIVIHARESFDEIFEVLDRVNDDQLSGVLHCFTGSVEQAKRIINYGNFMLGFGGVLTYKKANLGAVLNEIDLQHVVLETDAPYLTPVPFRGKRNESSYVRYVAEKVAEVKRMPLHEVADITTKNAERLFRW